MARTYPYLLVDAFTDRPLCGNACAVVLDADGLAVETMQAIAREMNLSSSEEGASGGVCAPADVPIRHSLRVKGAGRASEAGKQCGTMHEGEAR